MGRLVRKPLRFARIKADLIGRSWREAVIRRRGVTEGSLLARSAIPLWLAMFAFRGQVRLEGTFPAGRFPEGWRHSASLDLMEGSRQTFREAAATAS